MPDGEKQRKEDLDTRKAKAIEIAVQTFDALATDRGDSGKIWASVLKNAIKRRKPDFNETYYGFRAFGNLLEEAQSRGLLEVGRDEKSGTYVYRSATAAGGGEAVIEQPAVHETAHEAAHEATHETAVEVLAEVVGQAVSEVAAEPEQTDSGSDNATRRKGRGGRAPARKKAKNKPYSKTPTNQPPNSPRLLRFRLNRLPLRRKPVAKAPRKSATRSRRPRKAAAPADSN